MTKQELFQQLWEKYLGDQKMTAGEIRQLRVLVQDRQLQDQLDHSLDALYAAELPEGHVPEADTAGAFEALLPRLSAAVPGARVVAMRSRRVGWKWAVAAVILLLAGGSIYGWLRYGTTSQAVSPLAQIQAVIQPGGDKAMLTLADGSVISLNDAANGTLAQQGNTEVIKLANGQLAYQGAAGAASAANLYNTIVTPRGGRYHITLPDGSKVWLNASSSLHYPTTFRGSSREVTLTGEAYFEIAAHASMPFMVQVNQMKVAVLGTRFNIMAYADEDAIRTTLLQGSVRVHASHNGPAAAGDAQVLQPGQCASLYHSNGTIAIQSQVDTEEAIAWKNNQIQFAGTDICTAMRMIARWYDVEVEYKGAVPAAHFHGSLSNDVPVSEVLQMMQQTGEVHFEVSGRKIIVRP